MFFVNAPLFRIGQKLLRVNCVRVIPQKALNNLTFVNKYLQTVIFFNIICGNGGSDADF